MKNVICAWFRTLCVCVCVYQQIGFSVIHAYGLCVYANLFHSCHREVGTRGSLVHQKISEMGKIPYKQTATSRSVKWCRRTSNWNYFNSQQGLNALVLAINQNILKFVQSEVQLKMKAVLDCNVSKKDDSQWLWEAGQCWFNVIQQDISAGYLN